MDEKIERLKAEIESKLPQAKEMVATEANIVVLHQDAFAADLQDEEFSLLGKFIKYVGLSGKEIKIIGKNDETVERG